MINAMFFDVLFDRNVIRGHHYVSPGGYTFVSGGKSYRFDFLNTEGWIDEDDPRLIHFHVFDFDETYGDPDADLSCGVDKIEDFYIHTGDYDDPELNPILVRNLVIVQDEQEIEVSNAVLDVYSFD